MTVSDWMIDGRLVERPTRLLSSSLPPPNKIIGGGDIDFAAAVNDDEWCHPVGSMLEL
jgi:hypothetical protein